MACPKTPARDARGCGVRAVRLLLLVRGRAFGVFCKLCADASGCFLMVDTGRDSEESLLGVAAGVGTFALALLPFPGAVIDSLLEGPPNPFGVAGDTSGAPSLVDGLLLFDIAEAGRSGGGMLLSALKKLDLRLPFPPAGDEGSCDRLSTVLSESDWRLFFFPVFSLFSGSGSSGSTYSGLAVSSRNPALELALEDALEADLKPSRLPNISSSLPAFDEDVGRDGSLAWREGGRAKGLLNTGASFVFEEVVVEEVRGWPKLGIPLTRREEGTKDVRREFRVAGVAVEAVGWVLKGTSDALDVFFCSVEFVGRDIDEREGFFRSCSVEAGARNWDWLPDGLSTGSRDAGAGLGMPEGRGMEDCWSMVSRAIRGIA
jgi:hypothetical protein